MSCVIHDLQLVIKDSKKGCTAIDKCVETVAAAVASSGKSNLIKERIELVNGFLAKRNQTRWNSEHNMVKSFLKIRDVDLDMIFEKEDGRHVLTSVQRKTLKEFVEVLEPFKEATMILQKEAFSIGHVLPIYRGMLYELNSMKDKLSHCEKFRKNLIENLNKRLGKIYILLI